MEIGYDRNRRIELFHIWPTMNGRNSAFAYKNVFRHFSWYICNCLMKIKVSLKYNDACEFWQSRTNVLLGQLWIVDLLIQSFQIGAQSELSFFFHCACKGVRNVSFSEKAKMNDPQSEIMKWFIFCFLFWLTRRTWSHKSFSWQLFLSNIVQAIFIYL